MTAREKRCTSTAGYSEQSVTAADLKRAERAMEALIKAMNTTLTG